MPTRLRTLLSRTVIKMSEKTTTYRYVSLLRATRAIPPWDVDEGEAVVFAGKQPDPWLPQIPTEDGDIGGYRLDRVDIVELPEWMTAEDAFEWADDHAVFDRGDGDE